MRKWVWLMGVVGIAAPAALAAQVQPGASTPLTSGDMVCGSEELLRARQQHDEREAARVAAGGTGRRLFFAVCRNADAAAPPAAEPAVQAAAEPVADQPTCAQLETAARREHDERERARIAANDDGVRYAFFFDCPLPAPETRWDLAAIAGSRRQVIDAETDGGSDAANAQPQQNAQPGAPATLAGTSFILPGNSGNSLTTTRTTPLPRPETAEDFYNRERPPVNTPSFDDAVAARRAANGQPEYARSATAEVGGVTVENESSYRCTETFFERSCTSSGSVSVGNSAEARNAAREALESLRRDDD